jgi:alkanesulfonate monooxygenase SsuD/methylene tetrahydromethanopterin reductase-like flavin-dependent oxidoreductase (luciferase family)
MPQPGVALEKLGFLTIGLFDGQDPGPGHQVTLEMIELGERLGFDSAWVRHRHLQYGISSPVAVLAAAAQRTSRIELGTAVIPLGWENPLRLAEDLATVDILSGGRLNPGFSVGPPRHWEDVREALYPDTWEHEDFSYERVSRLLRFVAGETAATLPSQEGFEQFSSRVEPHSPGLRSRMWYGGASLASAKWAGENSVNFLVSSVVKAPAMQTTEVKAPAMQTTEVKAPMGKAPVVRAAEALSQEPDQFAAVQLSHIRAFRDAHPAGGRSAVPRVSQGLVVIPTDSASPAQRAKYEAYVAARTPRTTAPVGPERLLFARDIIGTSAEIAAALYAHAAFREVTEVAFALPFSFEHEDYVQILTDMATTLGPALGWVPKD